MTFKIETRQGWFCEAEKIAGYSFPATCSASYQGATEYHSRLFAEKAIKRNNLGGHPHWAHIEICETELTIKN